MSYNIEEKELLEMLREAYEEGRCGFYDLKEDAVVGIWKSHQDKKLKAAGIPSGVDPAAYMRSQLVTSGQAFNTNTIPPLTASSNIIAGSIGYHVTNNVNSLTGTPVATHQNGPIQFDSSSVLLLDRSAFVSSSSNPYPTAGNLILDDSLNLNLVEDRTISFMDNNTDSAL